MTTTTYTPAEYNASFPRARGHEAAIRYVAVRHHPKKIPGESEIEIGAGEKAVRVGWTNISGTRAVTRFAVVAQAGGE